MYAAIKQSPSQYTCTYYSGGDDSHISLLSKMSTRISLIIHYIITVTRYRQLIYNYPEQLFADKGVMAIEHADFEGVERLALVTGESCALSRVLAAAAGVIHV